MLVTGLSGTGKSSALDELERRGYRVVETDVPPWCEWIPPANGAEGEWLWREEEIARLLARDGDGTLFVSGCVANQGTFYDRFDAVVLLSAPADAILERIERRTRNDFGKSPGERELILSQLGWVEPLLRQTCTHELDAAQPLERVVEELVEIARAADA